MGKSTHIKTKHKQQVQHEKKPLKESTKAVERPRKESTKVAEKPRKESTKAAEKPRKESTKAAEKPRKESTKAAEKPRKESTKASSKPVAESLCDTAKLAIAAYKEYFTKHDEKAESLNLIEKKRQVVAQFYFDRCPENPDISAIPLTLVKPVNTEESICLIVRAPQRFWKDKVAEEAKALGDRVERVIEVDKLLKKFQNPEDRMTLLRSYDTFFCDRQIVDQVVPFLGHKFKNHWKCPIKVTLSKSKSIADMLMPVYEHTTNLKVSEAAYTSVRLGSLGRDSDDLAANLISALKGVQKHLEERQCNCSVKAVSLIVDGITVQLVEPLRKVIVQ